MPLWAEVLLAVAVGPALWLAGAIFFDFVHWVLHAMLRSRCRPLRALAWPHAVHHRWIDRNLDVRWENQWRNVWCHIVPEYLTQLVFSAALCRELEPAGAAVGAAWESLDEAGREALDVLVLCDPGVPWVAPIEAFARATRTRKLPPEVWAVYAKPDDSTARHRADLVDDQATALGAAPIRAR